MKTQQKGFTLIELIIVIVVLGILAVTAAPQFFNFSSDARASTVKGMEGSVKAASALVYAKALLEPGASSVDVDQYNTSVTLTAGYAAATVTGGITEALDMSDFDAEVAGNDVDAAAANIIDVGVGVKEGDLLIYPKDFGVNDKATPLCYVVYRAATATTAPVIFAVTDGC